MISRTLKRPMFRMGGSANEGITSGLNAPRQNYSTAGQVLPYNMADLVKQSQTQAMDPAVRAAYQPYFEKPQGEGLSRFLINFGLNLASTPPVGKGFSGLISTAAGAAKQPTTDLFEDIDKELSSLFTPKEGLTTVENNDKKTPRNKNFNISDRYTDRVSQFQKSQSYIGLQEEYTQTENTLNSIKKESIRNTRMNFLDRWTKKG